MLLEYKEKKKNQLCVGLQSPEEAAGAGRMELATLLTPAVVVLHLDTLVSAVRRPHTPPHTHTAWQLCRLKP